MAFTEFQSHDDLPQDISLKVLLFSVQTCLTLNFLRLLMLHHVHGQDHTLDIELYLWCVFGGQP